MTAEDVARQIDRDCILFDDAKVVDVDSASRLIEQYGEHRMEQMRQACGDRAFWNDTVEPDVAHRFADDVLATPLPPEEP